MLAAALSRTTSSHSASAGCSMRRKRRRRRRREEEGEEEEEEKQRKRERKRKSRRAQEEVLFRTEEGGEFGERRDGLKISADIAREGGARRRESSSCLGFEGCRFRAL